MPEFNWTCPYCSRIQTVTDKRYSVVGEYFSVGENKLGSYLGLYSTAISCANKDCGEVTVSVTIGNDKNYAGQFYPHKTIVSQRIRPTSYAKPQPDYVPGQIREDYYEACMIRDLSPKASATLARRCIQGMIRDYCQISGATLYNEIESLKERIDNGNAPIGVSAESVEALHHVRTVGNIGAHMEKDVNHVVNVDREEAQALIDIAELLFEDWYVARKAREDRFAKIKQVAVAKLEQKQLKNDSKSI